MLRTYRSALRHALRVGLAGSALAMATVAQAAAQPASYSFNIRQQPLSSALEDLARQAHVSILFRQEDVAGKQAQPLLGQMDALAAVRRLLDRSGLDVSQDETGALIVSLRKVAQAEPVMAAPAAEPIVVTGYANSLVQALNEKRAATNVVESIKAEDMGKFPAQNIAEALQRVPGVSIVRDRGEGVFVRVRGLAANFQVVTLNGRNAAVNENMRDSGQSGRQFRFDTLPSELMAAVDVVKSPRADLAEGGIGGIINLRTFRPLDLKMNTLALSATGSMPQLAEKVNPRLSAMGNWRSDDGRFGALLAVVFDKRSTRQDRITSVGWADGRIDANADGTLDSQTLLVPTGIRPTLELEDRTRWGLSGAVQWQPSDELNIALDGMWSRLNIHYDEHTASGGDGANVARGLVAGSAVVQDGVLTAGTLTNNSTQIGREISTLRYTNWVLGGHAKWEKGPWQIALDGSVARAFSGTPNPIMRYRLLGSSGSANVAYGRTSQNTLPTLQFLTANLSNPSLLPGRRIEWRTNRASDADTAGQLDIQRDMEGVLSRIKLGAKYETRGRDYTRRDINFTNGIAGRYFDASFFESSFPVDNFLASAPGNLPRSWAVPNPTALWAAVVNPQALLNAPLGRADLRNSYHIAEKVLAGYAMGEFGFRAAGIDWRGDLGLRLAQTRQTSAGYADNGTVAKPVSYTRNYLNALPSFNLVGELTKNVQLRMAASKVITRPSLADLAPRLTVNSNALILTAVGGNPELKPFEAWQYDAGVEWYFAPGSALMGGVFYKDIGTFVFQQTRPFLLDGQTYALTAPENGGNAYVAGVEVAYQQLFKNLPAPFDGLGFMANYTHTKSGGTYAAAGGGTFRDSLTDVARDSFNLTGFYEKGPIGLRLAYSWRGNVLRDVGGAGLTATNDKAFGSLDFDASYKLRSNVTLVLQGINMANASQWLYVRDDRFAGYTNYGRTLMAGVRAKF